MRQELSDLAAKVIDGAGAKTAHEAHRQEERQTLVLAADLVTRARTAVDFDYRGDVSRLATHWRAPTRFAKQLDPGGARWRRYRVGA